MYVIKEDKKLACQNEIFIGLKKKKKINELFVRFHKTIVEIFYH